MHRALQCHKANSITLLAALPANPRKRCFLMVAVAGGRCCYVIVGSAGEVCWLLSIVSKPGQCLLSCSSNVCVNRNRAGMVCQGQRCQQRMYEQEAS